MAQQSSASTIPNSPENWARHIEEMWQRREKTFLNEPDEMIGAYNREHSSVQDYHGREILEMLQNADDAGVGYASSKNMALILGTSAGLCVANTGLPFSVEGIRSLMISDRSPKQLARASFIGNRGLGFRSILAWTDSPFILSGQLRLGFSTSIAQRRLQVLARDNRPLKNAVKEMKAQGHASPIPILACPAMLDESGAAKNVEQLSDGFKALWPTAMELQKSGYDTVIGIPFKSSRTAAEAKSEIDELSPELMLFLQYLGELRLQWGNNRHECWTARRKGQRVEISAEEDQQASRAWHVYSTLGKIPAKFLDGPQKQTPGFEIKIAVSLDGESSRRIYNYFPTQIRFPYPVVAHATLELTKNRQNLVDNPANRYLVTQLAKVLAQVAAKQSRSDDLWRPLRLITAEGDLDTVLEEFGFEAELFKATQQYKIVPVRRGDVVEPKDARTYPGHVWTNPESWLPKKYFGDFVLWTDDRDLNSTVGKLDVANLPLEKFRDRLNRASPNLTLKQRAGLIAGLADTPSLRPDSPAPALLVDEQGDIIPVDSIAYLPPSRALDFKPPFWLSLQFLSRHLTVELMKLLRSTAEELGVKLEPFGVRSYEFASLARAIVTRVEERCQQASTNKSEIRLQGLRALQALYGAAGRKEDRPPDLKVALPTRTGKWEHADKLYLGSEYPSGQLMEALLGRRHRDHFVCPPHKFGGKGHAQGWDEFLQWLGVSILPKTQKTELFSYSSQEYFQHVRRSLSYPVKFDEFSYSKPEDVPLTKVSDLATVEFLDSILAASNAHAILAWMSVDPRFEEWHKKGDIGAHLFADVSRRSRYLRALSGQRIPSFVLWNIQSSPWLPTDAQRNTAPELCVRAHIASEAIRRLYPQPAIDLEAKLFTRLRVSPSAVQAALDRIGVRRSLKDLTWEHLYQMLLKLPKADPDGQAALELYRIMVEKETNIEFERSPARQQYQREGRLWCRQGAKNSYRPLSDNIYLIADPAVPSAVAEAHLVLDLPKGQKIEKIQRLFGVQALRSADVRLTLQSCSRTLHHELLSDDFARLKQFILAFRLGVNPETSGSARLSRLDLIACTTIEAIAKVSEREIEIRLEKRGESLRLDDSVYIIAPQIDERRHPLADPIVANSVAGVIADLFQLERLSDFARLAAAPHEDRRDSLTAILGRDDVDALLDRARKALHVADDEDYTLIKPAVGSILPKTILADFSKSVIPNSDERKSIVIVPNQVPPPIPQYVTSVSQTHQVSHPRKKIEIRVQSHKRGTVSVRQAHLVVDGDRCEELIMRFEEGQGRIPLLVGAIQGNQGFGCDILSFETAEACEKFAASGDLKLIQRFIEVKGRGQSDSQILLAGNQLSAARQYRTQFYLYRIYEVISGRKWQLTILSDPLAVEWPVMYSVDLASSDEAEYWIVETPD